MRDPHDSHDVHDQQDLIKRLQAGDEQALAALADAYRPRIFQLAFRYLRNQEDAEEVTQDVLYKVYRNVASFRGDSALSSWIYRITFNAAMSPTGARWPTSASSGRSSAAASFAPSWRFRPSTGRR